MLEGSNLQRNRIYTTTIAEETTDAIYHAGALGLYVYLASLKDRHVDALRVASDHFSKTSSAKIVEAYNFLMNKGFIELGVINDKPFFNLNHQYGLESSD